MCFVGLSGFLSFRRGVSEFRRVLGLRAEQIVFVLQDGL
jgi:hypothetical protein